MSNVEELAHYHKKKSRRPTIQVVEGDLERIVDEAEAALIAADRGVYQRDARLVSIGDTKITTANSGEVPAKRIFEHAESALAEDLCCSAQFEKYNERKKAFVSCDPPGKIIKILAERQGRFA